MRLSSYGHSLTQVVPDKPNRNMPRSDLPFRIPVDLKINEELCFEDGLRVKLNSFSHKHPFTGGPTKAMADLSISKGDRKDEATLAVHGRAGLSEAEDGLSAAQRYDTLIWHGYEFRLVHFDYDRSINIIVSRKL